jgi:acetyl esterase/lipase
MATDVAPLLPGRLGKPDMTLAEDPRVDRRLLAMMEAIGLLAPQPEVPVDGSSPLEAVHEFVATAEAGFEGLFGMLSDGLAPIGGVARSVEVIRGVDGNDITLYLHRPTHGAGPWPGILHLHGGGMAMLEAAGQAYVRWRDELAASGLVVVGVEFRNAGGKHGPYPFPAGLDDCTSALRWMDGRRRELGINTLVVSGESGGGNLTLATALRAKRDGDIGSIDGVYAMCPYISGAYAAPPAELTSLHENDTYFIDCRMMSGLVRLYDPDGAHADDPLAWPYRAVVDDLVGLPPHVISVNELDPLRDEGLAYYRRLAEAGVRVACRTVNGTTHGGDMMFEAALPDIHAATLRDITGFAESL